nr:MAG TPA: hypothetical protein [Crassvirales sp.]
MVVIYDQENVVNSLEKTIHMIKLCLIICLC